MVVATRENSKLTLRPAQGQIFNDPRRFVIAKTGRRFGKTYVGLTKLLASAAAAGGGLFYYCAPSYRMAKDIAWDLSKRIIPDRWVLKRHEGELKITLINGSKIELKGTESPDSLRGRSLNGAVLDECAFMQATVWKDVIRPSLADKRGWALFCTTPSPEGCAGWFYELCLLVNEPDKADPTLAKSFDGKDWGYHHYSTVEGGNVPPEEIESARSELDEVSFRREWLGEDISNAGLVASCFSNDNIDNTVEDNPHLHLQVGVDFNASPLTAVLGYVHKDRLFIFDEIVMRDATTWDLVDELHARFGDGRVMHAFPDPTGARRQTSGVGATDHQILRRGGIRVHAPRAPWNIKDKVMAVNAALRTADGTVHTLIHPRCRELIKSFRTLGFKPGTSIPNKDLGVDHAYDAFGYLVLSRFNLAKPRVSGKTGLEVW